MRALTQTGTVIKLFDDTVSSSDYIDLNARIIGE